MTQTSPPSAYDFPKVWERVGIKPGGLGCIMLDLEPIKVRPGIPADEFYYSTDSGLKYVQGPVAEQGAHVTLLYGLTPDAEAGQRQRESVDELLARLDLSSVTVDAIGFFPSQIRGEDYSCIVAHIRPDGDLLEANRRLRFLPHVDTFVAYRPHVTLAYVRQPYTHRAVTNYNGMPGAKLKARGVNYGGEL